MFAAVLAGCRQKGDIYIDPNDPMNMSYTSYEVQFEIFWRGMNNYYVFWSEDTTDWDATYYRMQPKFKALDEAFEASGTPADSLTFTTLYQEATHGLLDHHMAIMLRDVHTDKPYLFEPGKDEVLQREYVAGQKYGTAVMKEAIESFVSNKLIDAVQWGKMEDNENCFGIRTLENGKKIAYLWQSAFDMTASLSKEGNSAEEKQYINNIQAWLEMCLTDPDLAGIILDNRCNNGGSVVDLDYVVGAFISEPLHYADTRYKEGAGRYDYTDWIPCYVDTAAKRRDLEAEGIPYIVLTNAFTISMAEISAEIIKKLPTGRMIGERTYGAHGVLMPYSTFYHDGTFGDKEGKHYVYTASRQMRFVDDGVLEGKGITPTKAVFQSEEGYAGAITKAIDYIKGY